MDGETANWVAYRHDTFLYSKCMLLMMEVVLGLTYQDAQGRIDWH